jgi:hypothetical protein
MKKVLMRKKGPNCEMKYSYSMLAREVGGTQSSYGLLYIEYETYVII